jgi:hypothetical protein
MHVPADSIPSVSARLCRVVAALTPLAAAAFLAFVAYRWLAPSDNEELIRGEMGHYLGRITVTPLARAAGCSVNLLHVAVLAYALWSARALLLRIAAGQVFEIMTGALLRRFGKALLVYASLIPLVNCATLLIVTLANPRGERALGFGLGSEEITLALVSVVVLVTGSVMTEAARLAADHRQII